MTEVANTPDTNAGTAEPTICVFCGSSAGAHPAYAEAARALGAALGKAGMQMVFGGGDIGLMGEVARAVRAGGRRCAVSCPASCAIWNRRSSPARPSK